MKLVKAMLTVSALTMASRVVGLVRDVLTARYLGAGLIADAFFVALRLPNFFRRVTAEGAFSVSFVPIYAKKLETEGEKAAADFAGNAVSWMTILLAPMTLLFMIFMPQIIHLIAPGFKSDAYRFDMAVEMSLLAFPYMIFISVTALFGGMLNAHERFAPFAAAPILFNLCLVIALLTGSYLAPTVGHAMAWGVSISGVLQLLMMLFYLRRYKIGWMLGMPKLNDDIRRLGKLMVPGILGAGIVQINLLADMVIGSFLGEGTISYLYYADRLNQLPLGVVGVAVGTALLPMLSRAVHGGNTAESNNLFNRSLEICFLLALPAATALLVIPTQIVHVLFERGAFTAADTAAVSAVLMGYALGLPSYVSVKVLASVSWAEHDTVTPVKMAVLCTSLNIVLAVVLSHFFGPAGISMGTGFVGWLQYYLMWRTTRHRAAGGIDPRAEHTLPMIFVASAVMALVLYLSGFALNPLIFGASETMSLAGLGAMVALGGGVYFVLIFGLGILRVSDVKQFLTRKRKPQESQA